MMSGGYESLVDRLWRAVVLLLATAFAMSIAWQLVEPMLPTLVVFGVLVFVIKLALNGLGRRRRW